MKQVYPCSVNHSGSPPPKNLGGILHFIFPFGIFVSRQTEKSNGPPPYFFFGGGIVHSDLQKMDKQHFFPGAPETQKEKYRHRKVLFRSAASDASPEMSGNKTKVVLKLPIHESVVDCVALFISEIAKEAYFKF